MPNGTQLVNFKVDVICLPRQVLLLLWDARAGGVQKMNEKLEERRNGPGPASERAGFSGGSFSQPPRARRPAAPPPKAGARLGRALSRARPGRGSRRAELPRVGAQLPWFAGPGGRGRADGAGGRRPFGVHSAFLRAYVADGRRGRPRSRGGGQLLTPTPACVRRRGDWHRCSCWTHWVTTTQCTSYLQSLAKESSPSHFTAGKRRSNKERPSMEPALELELADCCRSPSLYKGTSVSPA